MTLYLHSATADVPKQSVAIVDFSGRGEVDPIDGVLLKFVEPDLVLTAARAAAKFDTPWVLLRLDVLELSATRAAAFACTLAECVRGDLHVVLPQDTMRRQQIAGHLQRAIAQAARR